MRVHVAGLTHGLLRVWQRGRIPLLPAVLSQEIAGVVAETGPGVDAAITALRKGGQAVLVGGNWGELSLPYGLIMTNGWGIRGCQGGSRQDALGVLGLLEQGRLQVGDLISHRYPLEQVNEAVETIESRSAAPLLVVVDVAGEETE